MNLRDLPDFNDLFIQFRADYNYDKAFYRWWSDMEESFQDLLGEKGATWLKGLILCYWDQSPMALRILDDQFFDEIRRWRDSHA